MVRLDAPDPGALRVLKEMNATQQTFSGVEARIEIHFDNLALSLVEELRGRLGRGEILASAFTGMAVERVSIPPARWPSLRLNFSDCRAEGQVDFTEVVLWLPEPTSAELEARCVTWLRSRQAEGIHLKKQLLDEALACLSGLKNKEFDAAYKLVFERKRGRPRKSKLEK